MKNKDNKLFFSAPEVAKILKVSRMTIINKIKQDLIKAEKIGRNYIVPREEVEHVLDNKKDLTEKDKKEISSAVEKAIEEYGNAIRMLGKE